MTISETKLRGCFVLTPKLFNDERGYFFESFNKQSFEQAIGKRVNFVQDNQSFSTYGVIRALHYQLGDHAQAKLVHVLQGKVLDVAVDLRRDSPTFGEHFSVELSYENKKQLFIPRGFAHGFVVLSDTAEIFYKCDNYYNKDAEGGIIYNDSELNIDWLLPDDKLIISEKDLTLPQLKNALLP
ncbi:dTDP-4-dehydrorhamnose 3,5-epimerase [uncultured Eudoraea sp.]|uniref:dTDP-4-dehydrorhamnose 3,5-epimerase n=1 Tax=uncultured Eudoraea sp. TaxID=1035614 RepID=UPI0026044DDF|nr:dTDP-4-dehydrorhamnose 3,5-epimerase [uncultured Eudoraea sp.]